MASNSQTKSSDNAEGTIIITGANGSLGFWFVDNLLQNYPSYFAVLAVRDDTSKDQNTTKLRKMVSGIKNAKFSIEAVDLASLSNVRSFADSLNERISTGKLPPISAVVCNAFNWSLTGQKSSPDGFDLSFQVSHLSHFVLVLKLLGSMDKKRGRIVFLGSEAHDVKNKNSFNPLGAALPENMQELIVPTADKRGEELARGFQRYGNAKLANVMFMHMLNRRLLEDPSLKHITALAMDPGGMPTSRAFNNAPAAIKIPILIASTLLPVTKYFTSMTTTQRAGSDLVSMSVGPGNEGLRGYFEGCRSSKSSDVSHDELKQAELWGMCEKWAKLEPSESILK